MQREPSEDNALEAPTLPPSPAPAAPVIRLENLAGDKRSIPGYEILEELGRGGMGVVYKARQVGLKRTVALKMILAGAHAGAEDLARFRLEAEAVARLQHPHIIPIYETGELAGCPYFSLEFMEGGSLAAKLDGKPWRSRAAGQLIATLAEAIHAAHQRHIIHRDLKPANVLLTADGTPKIGDFGLAKKLDKAPDAKAGPLSCDFALLGTPSYMAPEQAAGAAEQIGPATDVYGLGAILYELLTGRPPFRAATPMDTVLQLLEQEPARPRQWNARVSRDLEAICLKCLEKSPQRRYQTAEELARDLHAYLRGEPTSARRIGPLGHLLRWMRQRPALAATLLAVSVFYMNHLLLLLVVKAPAEGGSFHWRMTWLLLLWATGAFFFQWLVNRPRWHRLAVFCWAGMDVLFFTGLLRMKDGPSSSLLVGYLLLIALAALRFRTSLVWFVTELCLLSYTVLVVEKYWLDREQAPASPQTPVIFALSLLLMGFVMNLLLRRVRTAGSVS
ncbi:MAG TPA: serine/threonine-protein kinase [Gemmataceae bacterium]|nr:serine/threonine-protein kinase [Gemmataceae bacterium]